MDAFQINRTFDLLSLVEADTKLNRHGSYYVGPCPFCGGTDRFNLKKTQDGYRWFCRKCGDGKYHTSLDYIMRRDNIDFKTALLHLGEDHKSVDKPKPLPKPMPYQFELPDPNWQLSAWKEVDAASDRLLLNSDAMMGREYLLRRGLHRGVWYAWQLGFSHIFDPKAKCTRPAILLPWFDFDHSHYVVTAVKYRFIDENPNGLRYLSRRGSMPLLFGLWDALPEHHTLLIVEGEINALSIWQCIASGVSCVSFGSESGVRTGILKQLTRMYRRAFVWADDPKRAGEIRAAIGQQVHALRSPKIDGVKWDANRMLQERVLMDFLSQELCVPCLGKYEDWN